MPKLRIRIYRIEDENAKAATFGYLRLGIIRTIEGKPLKEALPSIGRKDALVLQLERTDN